MRLSWPVVLLVVLVAVVAANVALAHEPAKTGPAAKGVAPPGSVEQPLVAASDAPARGGASTSHSLVWWRHRAQANRRAYRAEHARWLAEKAHMRRLSKRLQRAEMYAITRTLQAHEPGPTVWDTLIRCEAAGYGWSLLTTGNGFYFAPQFTETTWNAHRGSLPTVAAYMASGRAPAREDQITVAERVLAEQGWDAWPTCSRNMGLR